METAVWQPLDAGWPFANWLTNTLVIISDAGGVMHAAADVHRAYMNGGVAEAVRRCTDGVTAASNALRSATPGSAFETQMVRLLVGWARMAIELSHLIGEK